jgi:hypothetical protein
MGAAFVIALLGGVLKLGNQKGRPLPPVSEQARQKARPVPQNGNRYELSALQHPLVATGMLLFCQHGNFHCNKA